jgi:hypothetical protein
MNYKPYTDRKKITNSSSVLEKVYVYRRLRSHRRPVNATNPAYPDDIKTRGISSTEES